MENTQPKKYKSHRKSFSGVIKFQCRPETKLGLEGLAYENFMPLSKYLRLHLASWVAHQKNKKKKIEQGKIDYQRKKIRGELKREMENVD